MPKLFRRRSQKTGLAPGTLTHVGPKRDTEVKITIFNYGPEGHFVGKEVETVDDTLPFVDRSTVTWINIDGVHQADIVQDIGHSFSVHPLVLEDILTVGQRPKVEDYEDYLYAVLKMLYWNDESGEIEAEQISIILSETFVITFQEEPERDVFEPVRQRIREGKGRIRKMGTDYLAYTLIDAIVDHYFVILETLGEQIEFLEEELITEPAADTLQKLHDIKRELIFLRKSVWPLREVVTRLVRGESPILKEATLIYFRDVYDHTIQVIETLETFRDMASGMLDIYLSSVSSKLNEVMKVLTIFATIFIPLTFVAGVYGMNFEYMPELEWRWGYGAVWLVMLAIGVSMLIYFWKKDWL